MSDDKTPVIFYYNETENDLFAVFTGVYEAPNQLRCYSHIGQHSKVTPEYIHLCRLATENEYNDLLTELINIGYDVLDVNKLKTVMRDLDNVFTTIKERNGGKFTKDCLKMNDLTIIKQLLTEMKF